MVLALEMQVFLGLLIVSALLTLLWLVQSRTGNAGIVDAGWAAAVGILGVSRDIDERVQAEKALRESIRHACRDHMAPSRERRHRERCPAPERTVDTGGPENTTAYVAVLGIRRRSTKRKRLTGKHRRTVCRVN